MLTFQGKNSAPFCKSKGPVDFFTDVESHHWQGRKGGDWMHFRLEILSAEEKMEEVKTPRHH